MTQHLVLSFIGDDKPGLVESLSEVIRRHHGNWLESHMAHLADKFAGILTLTVPADQQEALVLALRAFDQKGLKVIVETANAAPSNGHILYLSVVGNDKPGIIQEVSQVLHTLMINVKELYSSCEPAPMSSEMLFKADMVLRAPDGLLLSDVEAALERIGSDLMIELDTDPLQ